MGSRLVATFHVVTAEYTRFDAPRRNGLFRRSAALGFVVRASRLPTPQRELDIIPHFSTLFYTFLHFSRFSPCFLGAASAGGSLVTPLRVATGLSAALRRFGSVARASRLPQPQFRMAAERPSWRSHGERGNECDGNQHASCTAPACWCVMHQRVNLLSGNDLRQRLFMSIFPTGA